MATEQEQLDTQTSTEMGGGEFASDFPKVNTPDQSDIPHHPAADPTAPAPNQGEQSETG